MSAPQWLIDRMEALKKLPPPTLEKVRAQFEASSRFRKENAKCPRHKEYDPNKLPTSNCYHCWTAFVDRNQTEESVRLFWETMDKYGEMID